jgi:hypothetical protein
LEAATKDAPDLCLAVIRKSLSAIEAGEIRSTHRVAAALRSAIESVERRSKNDAVSLQICQSFSARVRKLDPRRTTRGANPEQEIIAAYDKSQSDRPDTDQWDKPGLDLEEQMRLIDVQRPYQVHSDGRFILRPGAGGQAMMTDALDGRALTVEVLLKLHRRLEKSFSAGGCVLSDGALFAETTRILKLQHSLPTPTHNKLEGMWDEIMSRQ